MMAGMPAQQQSITAGDLTVSVIRSRRRTATINVREGQVSVRVPLGFPEAAVREFVGLKSAWIRQKLQEQQQVLTANRRAFVTGERFAYLGRQYALRIETADKADVLLCGTELLVRLTDPTAAAEAVRSALIQWYRIQASDLLRRKVEVFQRQVGVEPVRITIRNCKTRWGSCSLAGRLMFNWKIIMAPEPVIDYLVVHELCHMLQHNHSIRYWRQVERVLPGYHEQRQWLRRQGRYLEI